MVIGLAHSYFAKDIISAGRNSRGEGLKINMWHESLKDIPYEICDIAVRKLIETNDFAPKISEIRRCAVEMCTDEQKTVAEAWQDVKRAIKHFGRNEEEKALASLDATTRAVVKGFGFIDICNSENMDVIRSNFIRAYASQLEREKSNVGVSIGVARQIEQIRSGDWVNEEEKKRLLGRTFKEIEGNS